MNNNYVMQPENAPDSQLQAANDTSLKGLVQDNPH